MARSNYKFQKRQKELARMKKKEQKRQNKLNKNNTDAETDYDPSQDTDEDL